MTTNYFVSPALDAKLRAQGFRPLKVGTPDRQSYYGGLFPADVRETAASLKDVQFVLAFNKDGVFLLQPPIFRGNKIAWTAMDNLAPHLVAAVLDPP